MANRVYDRQTVSWDADTLAALVEAGQATYFPKALTYVVKLPEGGSVAVRPEQVLVADGPDYDENYDGFDPDAAYERWLEDGGSHAASIVAEDEEERRREAMDVGLQMMRAQRRNLDAADAILAEGVPTADGGLVLPGDDDDLINHFSI